MRVCEMGALDEREEADRALGMVIASELSNAAPALIALQYPADPRAL